MRNARRGVGRNEKVVLAFFGFFFFFFLYKYWESYLTSS